MAFASMKRQKKFAKIFHGNYDDYDVIESVAFYLNSWVENTNNSDEKGTKTMVIFGQPFIIQHPAGWVNQWIIIM